MKYKFALLSSSSYRPWPSLAVAPSNTLSIHQPEEEQEVGEVEVEKIKVGESLSTGREETMDPDLHHHRATLDSTSLSLTSNIPPALASPGCR